MEMEKVIERIMATDFLDFATNILNQPHTGDVKLLEEVSTSKSGNPIVVLIFSIIIFWI